MQTHPRRGWRGCLSSMLMCGLLASSARAQDQQAPLVPESFALNKAAAAAINAQWLTDAERSAMRVFHGVWDDRDLTTMALKATVALNAWDFDNPALVDAGVPAEIRAEARLRAGDLQQAIDLLQSARTNMAARIRAEAFEGLGQIEAADKAVDEPVKSLLQSKIADAGELTEAVRAMFIRARIQGQPGRDFQSMMNLLGRAHQEIDRLYWPAMLAEAELLMDKDNPREAIGALHDTLSMNPRCAQAWYQLGRAALERFDFDSAGLAVDALHRLNRQHPLADLLNAESRLIQDDPESAQQVLTPLLKRLPKLRPALALNAATQAFFYQESAMKAALDHYDELSPGSAQAYYEVGRHLSMNRQYGVAAQMLEEAVRRQPAWPDPQIELGLMELQSGRDDRALSALKTVVKLDPFNKRASNSLFLLEELAKDKQIESEHFIVRYQPGVDQVLADMMLPQLEKIHATVSHRFGYEPPQKTVIELAPDHARFSVRITGMPFVETIAACTGPVIAMEVPKEGAPSKHLGLFDWPRVLQHEYTHTITLGQTRNRIPHWLTEAAAVSMEPAPRSYDTCLLLARAWREKSLFNLDEIKWAFVRPKKPTDRAQAYAQGHWMVEYMNERFGDSALPRLLEHYFNGEREQQAIPNALGISRAQFYKDFLVWAGTQVHSWGLAATPTLEQLTDELRWADEEKALAMAASQKARLDVIVDGLAGQVGQPGSGRRQAITADRWPPIVRPPVEITDQQLAQWIEKYPNHPDLLELQIHRRLKQSGEALDENSIAMLEQYARLRPIDPFPHKALATMWLASDTPAKAIEHLEFLDIREDKKPVYAVKLTELYQQAGDLAKALAKATRAVQINPYSAPNRELAATVALQSQHYDVARQHIQALTLLEPDRPQHAKRLAAIDKLIADHGG